MLKRLFTLLISICAATAFAAVDVNTAGSADLDSVKGIGPGTSSKLLEVRKNGKFKDWPDLIARMPGIGEKRAAKLSAEGLTVNGESFKAVATTTTKPAADKPVKAAAAPTPKQ
ncbi:ComEA family DNA-binding protein [Hydrogenophaga sp. RWCD_12]|uniref:ComEA family DNA-binding protein n=1 Tax=Hydrogenophaga sp. RWCD_12 TaxID=3391190 RepID=UPI0039850649